MNTVLSPPEWTTRAAGIVIPARRQGVIEETLDGQVLLYDTRTDRMHRLNETALLIWRHCDGTTSHRDIAASLTTTFEVDFETALDHVEETALVLAEAGLLELTERE